MRSWLVFALGVLLIAVVAAVGWLIGRSTQPPPINGVLQSAEVDNLRVTMQLDQAALGSRVLDLVVHDAAGKPVDLRSVRLRFTMAEMNMGAMESEAQPLGDGHFQARGSFFTMAGRWLVDATLIRDQQQPLRVSFQFPIAAPGEASGPLNPLAGNAQAILAGQQLYQANCMTCHGPTGKGDGPSAAGLNPRPADFSQHMIPGKHTDGQIYLWIKGGYPGSAMPAFEKRFSDEQLWQLVSYLRTFGQSAPTPLVIQAQATPRPFPSQPTQTSPQPQAQVPDTQEPLPPAVFSRQGNIWRSDGSGAPPRQLTSVEADSYAQDPIFSPDGGQVAFIVISQPAITATLPIPTSALYLMNADGSQLRATWKPPSGLLGLATWAPDGKALYIGVNGLRATPDSSGSTRLLQVVRFDPATGATQPVLQDALDPSLSRDGKQLAYVQLSKDGYTMSLMVAAADGSGPRQIVDGKAFQGFYAPRFSPDGKQIVVAAVGGPETDSTGRPLDANGRSPLERLLGLFEPATAEAHGLPWDLWIVNADGTGLRRLTWIYEDLPMASLSPDGKQIAVMGFGGIYLMNADGSQLRRIDKIGDHGGIDWSR